MKILSIILFLAMSVPAWAATVTLPYSNSMNSLSDFGMSYTHPTIAADSSSPDPSSVMQWTFPSGYADGSAPGIAGVSFSTQNELWIQYFFKYSSNWTWHSVVNKQAYIWGGADNFYTGVGMWSNNAFTMTLQGSGGSMTLQNTVPVTINRNTWYKVTLHVKVNSSSNSDGVAQCWINDVLVINRSNVRFWNGGANFNKVDFTPVWGGYEGAKVPSTQYLYLDALRIQTSPIGAVAPAPSPSLLKPAPPAGLSIN